MRYIFNIITTFSFTLSAQNQVVLKEVMNMNAPYVGEFKTTTTKYGAKNFYREEAYVEIDRVLTRVAMGGNKIVATVLNGKEKTRVVYNSGDEEFAFESFDTILSNEGKPKLNAMSGMMNMGRGSRNEGEGQEDQNDSNAENQSSNNEYSRTISESIENISGFDARKVTTTFKRGSNGTMVIEEWFTQDTTLFKYLLDIESNLINAYGGAKRNNPRSFSETMLAQTDKAFESVSGRMVKYSMQMKDGDNGFYMSWELKSANETLFKQSDYEVYKKYKKVDQLD